jgi:hypothetical protein
MKRLLNKSPLNRLCKFSHIKSDPWFGGFSWENLISLNMEPPYLPKYDYEKDANCSPFAFNNHMKNIKDWLPTKNYNISKESQAEYDKWFKDF